MLAKESTFTVNEQDCPPRFNWKVAVPTALGVPDTVKANEPAPLAKTPEGSVATRPVTPVEGIPCDG